MTLDGEPILVHESPEHGMLEGIASKAGVIEFTWVDHGRRYGWVSLTGILLLGLSVAVRRRGPAPALRQGQEHSSTTPLSAAR